MAKQTPTPKHAPLWRLVFTAALMMAAAYVLKLHWTTVHAGLQIAQNADLPWIIVALLLMTETFVIAANIYSQLALHRLRFRRTVLVEVASAFVNRLLPSGIGGLGLHGDYLYRQKHTPAQATTVVSVNNLLGMVGHGCLLVGVLVFDPSVLKALHIDETSVISWPLAGGLVLLGMTIFLVRPFRRPMARFGRKLLESVRQLPIQGVIGAFLLALTLTISYALILFCSAISIGISMNIIQAFVVLTLGVLAGTATPTPGGLVGAEAGLFGGFVAFGAADADAAAAVVLYRLITYWLPLLPGAVALQQARLRKLV